MTGFRSAPRLATLTACLMLMALAPLAQAAPAAASAAAAPAAPAPEPSRFTVSADGQEVTDGTTHLTWRRCVEGMSFDGKTCTGKKPTKLKFGPAKDAAAAVAKSAGKPWRLPTKDELVGLVSKTKKGPWIDPIAFPGTPASLTWATRPGFDDNLNAWLVNFKNGKVDGNSGQGKYLLRLVR